jgi:hypothetical protein
MQKLITMLSNVNKLKFLLLHSGGGLFNLANTRLKNRWRYNLIKIRE